MKNLLIIGSGAREHAIALKFSQSNEQYNHKYKIYALGLTTNPGIKIICDNSGGSYNVGSITEGESVLALCKNFQITLVIVGPEATLETGVVDLLVENKIKVVGPNKKHALIETSKTFTRDFLFSFLEEACPKYYVITSIAEAQSALNSLKDSYVIKADGLAGGKGVLIAQEHLFSDNEALAYCEELLKQKGKFVIEEKLVGQEFSLISLTDGSSFVHLPALQDHKRAYDGDSGPNTGGMGSYTDKNHKLPFLTDEELNLAKSYNELVVKQLNELNNSPYIGVLYGGYMACAQGLKIIEFNARFGDPEAMNLMYLIESDVVELFERVANKTLSEYKLKLLNEATVCTYVVPADYPFPTKKSEKVELGEISDDVMLCYGSVENIEGTLYTKGSRTLAFVGGAETIGLARSKVVDSLKRVKGNIRYRLDIGSDELIQKRVEHMKQLRKPLRVAILGSTNGTNLIPILEAINKKVLNAEVSLILSDKENSGILKKAKENNIEAHCLKNKGSERDCEITLFCEKAAIELIVLIGYMRILGKEFCSRWENRIINVHPSLLPEFANTMDLETHRLAINRMKESGNNKSGCTVHLVTSAVDSGPIVLQRECEIEYDDTPESLKKRVQEQEALALIEAINKAYKTRGKLTPSNEGVVS